jgi:hypothetical protein
VGCCLSLTQLKVLNLPDALLLMCCRSHLHVCLLAPQLLLLLLLLLLFLRAVEAARGLAQASPAAAVLLSALLQKAVSLKVLHRRPLLQLPA